MTRYLLEMFGVSLGLTLLLELPIGMSMGMRNRKQVSLMVLVNILTNPPAVLSRWLGASEIMIECIVVFVEAAVYLSFFRDEEWKIKHPIGLSVLTNGFSWLTGVLIQNWKHILRAFAVFLSAV